MKSQKKRNLITALLIVLAVLLIAVAAFAVWFFSVFYSVGLDDQTLTVASRNLTVFDSDNNEVPINSSLGKYVKFDDISPNIVNAFIATEDKRFFTHNGVDYKRTVGAMIHNIQAGYAKEGGSTITQQLIKNTKLSNEKTLERKIKEMRLAYQIEKSYNKNDIIEMYLNAIYFGNGIYGIGEACRQYYDKTPAEITVSEAAVLAGVVKNPRKNSLLNSVENANARKNLILRLMYEQNYIEETEYDVYLNETVRPTDRDTAYRPYSSYVDAVLTEASELFGISEKELIEGNFRVLTYLDSEAQKKLYDAYTKGDLSVTNQDGTTADYCAASLENIYCGINAYVTNLKQSVFDFRRQPGSAIKPFLSYLPTLEYQNSCALTKVDDFSFNYNGYQPKNYKDNYLGATTLREAVATSSNAVAVKLTSDIGLNRAKELAERSGIRFHNEDTSLPIALGGMTEGVTFLELLSAYATIANNGLRMEPNFVKAIFDENGNTLYQRVSKKSKAFSAESASLMTDMLIYNAKNGTAKKLSSLPFEVAAKTGTVGAKNGNNDAWCAAYNSEYTVIGWYGNAVGGDTVLPENVTGGSYPTIVCRHLLENLQKTTAKPFVYAPSVTEAGIDAVIYDEVGEFYLVPENFPKMMTKKCLFHFRNSPTMFSPNCIVAEPENFTVELYQYPIVSFAAKQNEIYRVYRQDEHGTALLTNISEHIGIVQIEDTDVTAESKFLTYKIDVINAVGIIESFYRTILY